MTSLYISPYVAAGIVEHVKRRQLAAGYLIGNRVGDGISITDFIPFTHVDGLADVNSEHYRKKLNALIATKRAFDSNAAQLGWYSAGNATGFAGDRKSLQAWCRLPAATFARGSHAVAAVHLHCETPSAESNEIQLTWTAHTTSNRRLPAEEPEAGAANRGNRRAPPRHECFEVQELPVVVSAQDQTSANVVLAHVASLALCNGAKEYTSSRLLNLDEVVFDAQAKNGSVSAALQEMQKKLQAVTSGKGSTGNAATDKEVANAVESLRQLQADEMDAAARVSTAREDYNTQRLKDALMIKCMTVLLRKEVSQIEMLATQYGNDHAAQNH